VLKGAASRKRFANPRQGASRRAGTSYHNNNGRYSYTN